MEISDTLAEKALIGSCLIDSSVYFRANIVAADFYDECHRNIWIAIGSVLREGTCDYITLVNYIKAHRLVIKPSYLTELITMSPTALNAESYSDVPGHTNSLTSAMVTQSRHPFPSSIGTRVITSSISLQPTGSILKVPVLK